MSRESTTSGQNLQWFAQKLTATVASAAGNGIFGCITDSIRTRGHQGGPTTWYLLSQHGIKELFRGVGFTMFRTILKELYRTPFRTIMLKLLQEKYPDSHFIPVAGAATACAVTDTFVLGPLEKLKAQIIAAESGSATLKKNGASFREYLPRFYAEAGGLSGLNHGWKERLLRNGMNSYTLIGGLEIVRASFFTQETLTVTETIAQGSMVTLINWGFTNPLDYAKTQAETYPEKAKLGLWQHLKQIKKDIGILPLYYSRGGPQNAFYYWQYCVIAALTSEIYNQMQRDDFSWRKVSGSVGFFEEPHQSSVAKEREPEERKYKPNARKG